MANQHEPEKGSITEKAMGLEVFVTACDIRKSNGEVKLGVVDQVFLGRQTAREYIRANYVFMGHPGQENIRVMTDVECDRFISSKIIK